LEGWKLFCSKVRLEDRDVESIRNLARKEFKKHHVYPDSIQRFENSYYFIALNSFEKVLIVYGENSVYDKFDGEEYECNGVKTKICKLSNENCSVIRNIFPFTNPSNHRGISTTIGLGDRLGVASPGHIRLIKDTAVFPVLAQQSIRELNLTGRTYEDVLSAASWAVFQEGYTGGFGADGDHLKTAGEVKMALDCGFTMITLDCSEYIDNTAASMPQEEVERKYAALPQAERERLESTYLEKEFVLNDSSKIIFSREDLKRIVLVYLKAVNFTIDIFNNIIKKCGRNIDFEMSIDETLTSTTPQSHFFVASELIAGGVEIASLAPRFCGEFQKGIDYKGDIKQFTEEFAIHAAIADYFGYKISVHSGSDKFSVFQVIGEKTGGRFHIKTAGTNWLEALRVISGVEPGLFRKIYKFAGKNLSEAKKYYHISADPANVPNVETLNDSELPSLLDMDDARQVMHITYGLILSEKDNDGYFVFKDKIYSVLNKNEEKYYDALKKHIGRHLKELRVEF